MPLRLKGRWAVALAVGVTLGVMVMGCSSGLPSGAGEGPVPVTRPPLYPNPVARDAGYDADPVLDWIDLHLDLVQREAIAPPYATRLLAHTASALQLGYALADPTGPDRPIAVKGMQLPRAPDDLNVRVVGSVAVAEVTRQMVPSSNAQRSVAALEAQQVAAELGEGDHRQDPSVLFGLQVADAVLDRSSRDGFTGVETNVPPADAKAGSWVPTPPDYLYALEPGWGQVEPFVVEVAECPVDDPVPFDETPGSAFYNQALGLVSLTANLSDRDRFTARYWDDRAGFSYTPTGHWAHILLTQLEHDAKGNRPPSLGQAARAYAAASIASYDALIATWREKYLTNLERPVTYVRRVLDPSWTPSLVTPNHPSYPSGHSAGSFASAAALASTIGDRPFTDMAHSDKGDWENRSYPGFLEAAAEASYSRQLGGIHYAMDTAAGQQLGQCVADRLATRL
jgi:hypothetical protein